MSTPKTVIIDIHGGIGKHIAGTAVVANLKAAYPESQVVIVCAYPAVFLNNPDVYRVYGYDGLRYFHNDYMSSKDFLFFKTEPYHHVDYIKKERHLIDVWTEQCGVPFVHKEPKIYLNFREQEFCQKKFAMQKPVLVLQTNGGTNLPFPYSWVRDIPATVAQKLVDALKSKYSILHIRTANQIALQDTIQVTLDNYRELFGLIKVANKRVLIDSFCQHATAALGESAVVLWPVDNVKTLGYESNKNRVSDAVKAASYQSPFSYIEDYSIAGNLHECPFSTDEIFTLTEIIESLEAVPAAEK